MLLGYSSPSATVYQPSPVSCSTLETHLSSTHLAPWLWELACLHPSAAGWPPTLGAIHPPTTWLQLTQERLQHKKRLCGMYVSSTTAQHSGSLAFIPPSSWGVTNWVEREKVWVNYGVDLSLYKLCVPALGKEVYLTPAQPHEKAFLYSFLTGFGLSFGSLFVFWKFCFLQPA